MKNQTTINKEITISGNGLHTNNYCIVTFCPANADFGIVFERIDLLSEIPTIPALSHYATEFNRNTTLKSGKVEVATVEHFLAAFSLLGINNLLVKVTNKELPILDGSAKPIVDALKNSIIELSTPKKQFFIRDHIICHDAASNAFIEAFPSEKLIIDLSIDFPLPIGIQSVRYTEDDNIDNITSSRTFVLLSELSYLYKNNLIKGGNIDNALVFADVSLHNDQITELESIFNCHNIYVTPMGVLNNTPFRNANEPAYHKLLDFIGDLSLIGCPVVGHIIAYKPGHSINDSFVKMLD